jgi:hypothetical protein
MYLNNNLTKAINFNKSNIIILIKLEIKYVN